jgi:hypothetical protein
MYFHLPKKSLVNNLAILQKLFPGELNLNKVCFSVSIHLKINLTSSIEEGRVDDVDY